MRKKFVLTILTLAVLAPTLVLAGHRANHPANLQDSINTPNFNYTVYYTNDNPQPGVDPDYFTTAQAQLVANALDTNNAASPANPGHHQLFLNLGLNAPFFNPAPPEVYIYNSTNLGGAYFAGIDIDAPSYRNAPEIDVRMVTGHELFHHVQYNYINDGVITGCSATWGQWTCEGTARMMQDKVYADLDADPGTVQASYPGEISNYLTSIAQLNTTLTSQEYKAALFWNYVTEQLGTVNAEPQRGVDVIQAYWQNASANTASPDPFGVLRTTINQLETGLTLEEVWHDFVIANYAKDLNVSALLSDASKYQYIDDDVTAYAQVATLIDSNFPPTIGPTASSVNSFAARYYVGRPNTACDIIGFQSTGDQAAYGLLAVTGTDTVARLYKSVTTDFAKALINRPGNPYTRLVAVVGGLSSGANYDYTFACGDASLQIVRPNTTYRALVGEPDDPERFLIIVNVAGPPELGTPSVQGLDVSDFQAFVGPEDPSNEAIILSGAYVQGSYWLVAQAPVKDAAGTYPLLVKLGELAADTEEGVVEYTKVLQDQVLVIDASGSMNFPAGNTKLDAAKNAGRLFVDAAALDDQLGIVWFSGNGTEPDNDAVTIHQLQPVLGQRNIAKDKIDAILPQNLTSIGDGLNEGQSEIDARGIPEGQDVIVLLSDGLENEAEFWADIQAAITGAGTVVHAIALGPTTDQAKMQQIATATDGDYLYVDLAGASLLGASSAASATTSSIDLAAMPLPNRLANAYRIVNETIHRWQRLWENAGTIVPPQEFSTVLELPINIEEGGLMEPVFSLNWAPTRAGIEVTLLRPDGTPVESGDPGVEIFEDPTHKVYQLDEIAQLGTWLLRIEVDTDTVDYVASLSAKNVQGAQLDIYLGQFHFDPVAQELEQPFLKGLPMPIIATLTDIKGPIIGADVLAEVQHPDGNTDRLQLFDDGNHGDGDANDGIYANTYHRTTVGSTVGVDDRDEAPGTRGSYVVSVWASGNSNGGEPFERHKGSSFQLFEFDPEKDIGPEPDQDQDRLPDRWEQLHPCVNPEVADADADPDEDQLTNAGEFAAGTAPCDPDTDDGGEADGSEVNRGANPLEPQDDGVPFPVDVEVFVPGTDETTRTPVPPNANLIRFSAGPQVDTVLVFRSTSPTGPFELVATLDPTQQRGMYLDEGLENGTTYYYRLQLVPMNGFSPFSRVFSGTPREEAYPPRGSVLINGGATYAESTNATLTLNARKQLFTLEPLPEFTAEGLEMIISNSPDFTAAAWEPLQAEKAWTLAPDPETDVAIVYVKYRDEQGLESTIETDGIRLMPAGSLGSIKGKGLLEGQTDHTGILVMAPDNSLVQATFTNEAGEFLLADLLPGQYNLLLTRPSYLPQEVIGVTVNAGEVTDIGTITLVREEPIEVDFFPNSTAQIEIEAPFGSETVTLIGPTEVHVFIGPDGEAMDTDGDGRDQVQTEIVEMELSGTSSLLGPITVRLRDSALHPFQHSSGEIEENFDAHTGTLDLPPFTPSGDCPGGCTADSFFDVFFEIEVSGQVFHTHDPKRMGAAITHKPPAEGETYENLDVIELFDENEDPTGIRITRTRHTPNPPPTAIDLSSFRAEAGADSITLTWETASELDNEGFNLWRAEAADGEYTQINPSLIPAQGNPDSGASYQYTDNDVVKGVTYYYKLEDVDLHGVSTFHGPVSARPSPIGSIYLPLIFASSPVGSPCDGLETHGQLLSAAAESALRAMCAEGEEAGDAGSRRGLTPEIEAEARALLASPAIQVNAPDLAPPHPDQTTQSETAIAVAGDKVVVGWNDSSELVDLPNTSFSGYAYSTTGGATFTDGGSIPPGPVGPPDFEFDSYAVALGDPDITVDSAGNFYYASLTFVCLASDPKPPLTCTDSFIGVWKSVDGGATFTGPTLVRGTGSDLTEFPLGYVQDKPLITADTTGGDNSDSIYVSWTEFDPFRNSQILFSRSTDGGLTFSPAVPVTPVNGETDTVVQGSFPEVGPNGEIYVAWEEGWPGFGDRSIRIRRSNSGGLTFPGPDTVINASVNGIGSDENCGTEEEPSPRETLPGSIRSQEFPSIDVDHSGGPFNGNVYAVWNSDPDGEAGPDNADIFFSRSTDGGNTWSPPLVVNDDGTDTDQFFPFVRVTEAGTVAVMWYDRRFNGSDIDVFKAFSVDGGQTFGPNVRVTSVSFPVPPINPNFDPVVANCYMAEYNHMATQGATLYLTWGDNRNTLFTPDYPNGRPDPDVFFETEPDPAVLSLVLTPDTDTNEVETPHTVVATVTDGLGNPMPGLAIEFTVTGANTASGSGTSDAAGQATFTYTGTNEGDDTITAWVDRDGDGVQDPDEPSDTAAKTWRPVTAIVLVSFTASGQDGQVVLEWETASEMDNEGFNIWRSEATDGEYTRLNASLIPAQGNTEAGASYQFTDSDVVKGVTYYYQLEDVDLHGASTFHGPVSATPSP